MKTVSTFLFCLILSPLVWGQSIGLDSLKQQLRYADPDTHKVLIYLKFFEQNEHLSWDSIEFYLNEGLNLANNLNFQSGRGKVNLKLGVLNYFQGKNLEAIPYYEEALEIFEKLEDLDGQLRVQNNLGIVYEQLGNYNQAEALYLSALGTANKMEWKQIQAALHMNLGAVQREKGQLPEAIESFELSKQISLELTDTSSVAKSDFLVGQLYLRSADYRKSIQFFEKSLELFKEIGAKDLQAAVLSDLSTVYQELGDFDEAIRLSDQSQELLSQIGGATLDLDVYANKGALYADIGNNSLAIEYYKKHLVKVTQSASIPEIARVCSNLGVLYSRIGNIDQALAYYKRAKSITDTLLADNLQLEVSLNLGALYLEHLDEIGLAEDNYREAIRSSKAVGDLSTLCLAQIGLGQVYLKKEEYDLADSLIQTGYSLGDSLNQADAIELGLKALVDLYDEKEEFKGAIEYQYRLMQHLDSISTRELNQVLAKQEVLFQLDEKQDSIQFQAANIGLLKTQKRQQSYLNWAIGVALVFVLGIAYLLQKGMNRQKNFNYELSVKNEHIQALNQELNHRTKNNLRTVGDLLFLSSDEVSDPKVLETLEAGTHRIEVIKLIHELLAKENSESLTLDTQTYFPELVEKVLSLFETRKKPVEKELKIESFPLPADTTLHVGLILNEWLTNFGKYVIPSTESPRVSLQIKRIAKGIQVALSDNGPGLPNSVAETSLGQRLVQLMVRQLGAEFNHTNGEGTHYTLEIPFS